MARIIKHGFNLQEVIDLGSTFYDGSSSDNENMIITGKSAVGKGVILGYVYGGVVVLKDAGNSTAQKIQGQYKSYCVKGYKFGGTTGGEGTALIEIQSTTQGFLPPAMTTTEKNAISSPVTGLMVYDTTLDKLCVYTGAAWETITSA